MKKKIVNRSEGTKNDREFSLQWLLSYETTGLVNLSQILHLRGC